MNRLNTVLAALAGCLLVASLLLTAWPRAHSNAAPVATIGINRDLDGGPLPASSPTVAPVRATASPGPARTASPSRTPVSTRTPHPLGTAVPLGVAVHTAKAGVARYLVLFVLDGAQPKDYTVTGIPHIRALMQHGADFTNGFAGILESETPSGHATIASGSQPRQDGILSFAWANSDNTTVNLFDPKNIQNGQMENIIANAPSPDIADLVHKQDPKAQVVVAGGHKYYAQDALGGKSANVILYYTGMPNGTFAPVAVSGHTPPESLLKEPGLVNKTTHLAMGVEDGMTMHLVQDAATMLHPKVLMVNIPEFDWPLGHPDGADLDWTGVQLLMRGFDRDLGKLEDLYRKEGILNQTLFVLTSDHGFAPIFHHVDSKTIEQAVTNAGTSVVSDTFHTAGYLWVRDSSKAAAAAENIARLQNPFIQSVYFKEATPTGYQYVRASGADLFLAGGTEAANQYLLGTFASANGPDLVVFFTEDSAAEPGGQSTWKGDHGGAAWNSQHLRIILSGPGIKPGTVSTAPTPLMDIAPTALQLMGIAPSGMQGIPLTEAMNNPAKRSVQARTQQSRALDPIIAALAAESAAEIQAGK